MASRDQRHGAHAAMFMIASMARPAVAAVSHWRHSWGHDIPAACGDNTRPIFGYTDRDGGRAFGCSKGQSRTGQPGLAAAPFLAEGGLSTEAVG